MHKIPLINGEVNHVLTWYVNCVISNSAVNQTTIFSITNKKCYVPVLTLSTQDNPKLLQQLNSRLKCTINWYHYYSKTEPLNAPNSSLDFLIDPSFRGVNKIFVLPFNANDSRIRRSRYYVPTEKVEDYKWE